MYGENFISAENAKLLKKKGFDNPITNDDQPQFNLDVDENNVFTELAESEDEKIRKLIRSLLENARAVQSNTALYKEYDDALAWLEKQKEQKPDSLTKYVYSKEDEKFIQDCANILVANDYAISAERLLSMFKQSSAWSEEDERNWNNVWDVLDGQFNISEEARKKACVWFKSLRHQPKQGKKGLILTK